MHSADIGLSVCAPNERDARTRNYYRRQPEHTLLYQIIEQHLDAFFQHSAETERHCPSFVKNAFAQYLDCGRLEKGFLRVQCETCQHEKLVAFSCKNRGFCPSCGASRMAEYDYFLNECLLPERPYRQWVLSLPYALRFLLAYQPQLHEPVLAVVQRAIATFLIRRCGLKATNPNAQTGAVTFIQRFGSALNLNIHYHILALDGVYKIDGRGTRFVPLPHIERCDISRLLNRISERIVRRLVKLGWLERDDTKPTPVLSDTVEPEPFNDLLGQSITYRIATGPRRGQKALTLKTLMPSDTEHTAYELNAHNPEAGFSLHAGVSTRAKQVRKRRHLIRYLARAPVADHRLAINRHGQVLYELKSPYRDGTTHAVFEPIEFIARLAALVPRPRRHLVRYHGLFAPNHKHRSNIMRENASTAPTKQAEASRHQRLRWAERLKKVFNLALTVCPECQGRLRIIGAVEQPEVIARILQHIARRQARAPPAPSHMPLQLTLFA